MSVCDCLGHRHQQRHGADRRPVRDCAGDIELHQRSTITTTVGRSDKQRGTCAAAQAACGVLVQRVVLRRCECH